MAAAGQATQDGCKQRCVPHIAAHHLPREQRGACKRVNREGQQPAVQTERSGRIALSYRTPEAQVSLWNHAAGHDGHRAVSKEKCRRCGAALPRLPVIARQNAG